MGEFEDVMAALARIEAHAAAASTVAQENQGYLNGGRPGPVTEIRMGVFNSHANLAAQLDQLADEVAKISTPTVAPVDLEAVRQVVRQELAALVLRFRRSPP